MKGNFLVRFLGGNGGESLPLYPEELYSMRDVVGVEWDQSTDTWRHIDENGNTLNLSTADFDRHPIWGKMRRCNMAATGIINAYKGEAGYAVDGSNGRVMVEIPKCWVHAELPAANKYRWWFSANDRSGFEIHPAFRQSNGGTGAIRDFAYIGAYEADMVYDAANTHVELHSRTGKQPMTGGQIVEVAFDGGQNEQQSVMMSALPQMTTGLSLIMWSQAEHGPLMMQSARYGYESPAMIPAVGLMMRTSPTIRKPTLWQAGPVLV